MPYRIIVPHDYGTEAGHAVEWAGRLVESAGGSLVLLHVILVPAPPIPKVPMIPAFRPTEEPDQSLQKLRAIAATHGVNAEVEVFQTNNAGPGIVLRGRELKADLIAIGINVPARGGLARALLGSVVDYVIWNAGCPVVAVRPTATS